MNVASLAADLLPPHLIGNESTIHEPCRSAPSLPVGVVAAFEWVRGLSPCVLLYRSPVIGAPDEQRLVPKTFEIKPGIIIKTRFGIRVSGIRVIFIRV